MKISDLLLGKRVRADHPVTVLNPEETFIVDYVKFDEDRYQDPLQEPEPHIYVRGEETMWFHIGLVELVKERKEGKLEKEDEEKIEHIRQIPVGMTRYIWVLGWRDRGMGHGDYGIMTKKKALVIPNIPFKLAEHIIKFHNDFLRNKRKGGKNEMSGM